MEIVSVLKNLVVPSIVIFSTSEGIWGGSQTFNQSLCKYLTAHQMEAVLATSSPALYSCKTLRTAPISNRMGRIWIALTLAWAMRRSGSKAVILDDLSGLWLAPIFYLLGLRVISVLHLELRRRDKWGFGYSWVSFHILRLSSFFIHRTFSVGQANVEIFPRPVDFIGNFVADEFFDESLQEPKRYDLGAVSRLSPEKNLPLLLQLVRRLNEVAYRPINCIVAGDGTELESLTRLVAELGLQSNVTFHPWVASEKVPATMDQIRCFVITSHTEGFATTLLESHARGLPCIVRDTAGYCPTFVTGYGNKTGLVFKDSDLDDEMFLQSVMTLIDSHEIYRPHCVSKAALFSSSSVLENIKRTIVEQLEAS